MALATIWKVHLQSPCTFKSNILYRGVQPYGEAPRIFLKQKRVQGRGQAGLLLRLTYLQKAGAGFILIRGVLKKMGKVGLLDQPGGGGV